MSGKPSQAEKPTQKAPHEDSREALRVAQPSSQNQRILRPSLWKQLVFLLSVSSALVAISYVALRGKNGTVQEQGTYDIPPNVLDQFRRHDRDGDGLIDPYEFATLLNSATATLPISDTPAPVRTSPLVRGGGRCYPFFCFVYV